MSTPSLERGLLQKLGVTVKNMKNPALSVVVHQ